MSRQPTADSRPSEGDAAPPPPPPRRLASRVVYAAFLAVVAVFIVTSTWQIIVSVFGLGKEAVAEAPPGPRVVAGEGPTAPAEVARACADGVAQLEQALDRGFRAASTAGSEDAALRAFEGGRLPEWEAARVAALDGECARHPRGRDAYAALLRLKLAEEGFLRRQVVDLAPVRRDVEAYLPR